MWTITFTDTQFHGTHSVPVVMAQWKGYRSYQEARQALRDADMCIPIHWDHEIEQEE